jgi:DNA repair protein RAD5
MQFTPSPSPAAPTRQKSEPDLFFPSSDSEDDRDDIMDIKPTTVAEKRIPSPALRSRSRTPPSNGHLKGHKSIKSQDSDIIPIDQPSSSSANTNGAGPSRPLKRPSPGSRTSSFQVPSSFTGGYLGEFVCEGWSLSKGKGYCTPGSKIVFERPKAKAAVSQEKGSFGKGPAKLVGGKVVNGKTKQVTLGSMMAKKAAPAPPAKKAGAKPTVDSVIRFRNDRGFEVGRLSVTEATFLVHLLDTDISKPGRPRSRTELMTVSLTGHVIDCPQSLSTGCTILLNVKVFLTRKAFEKADKATREENGTFWQEQKETGEEEAMRQRKEALGFLFGRSMSRRCAVANNTGRIGVKALQSNALLAAQKQNGSATINEKSLKHFDKPKSERRSASPSKGSTSSADKGKGKSSAKNSDGEEEEDSGDEAEKLDEEQMNELDTIYRK